MNSSTIQTLIDRTQATIIIYMDAMDSLVAGGIESYKLDTGQTVQWVTKINVSLIQSEIDKLINRCDMLTIRLNGGGSVVGVPKF